MVFYEFYRLRRFYRIQLGKTQIIGLTVSATRFLHYGTAFTTGKIYLFTCGPDAMVHRCKKRHHFA